MPQQIPTAASACRILLAIGAKLFVKFEPCDAVMMASSTVVTDEHANVLQPCSRQQPSASRAYLWNSNDRKFGPLLMTMASGPKVSTNFRNFWGMQSVPSLIVFQLSDTYF